MDHRIQQVHHQALIPNVKKPIKSVSPNTAFKDMLTTAQELRVSKHAQERLIQRDIHLNESQWKKISEKVVEAKQKGVSDSLVITKNAALLVSAKNNTVVTAMDRMEAKSKIFTNINGTILIDE